MENVVITIARQYGSGGKTIGAMLAKDLGVNCYSREILKLASEESGINERLFGQKDERLKIPSWFKPLKRPYEGDLIPPESSGFVSDDNLFNYQAKIIKDLAGSESCVIVGRCADYVLRNYPNVISVFIHADREFCIERALERNSMTRKGMENLSRRLINIVGIFTNIILVVNGQTQGIMICVWIPENWDLKNVWKK